MVDSKLILEDRKYYSACYEVKLAYILKKSIINKQINILNNLQKLIKKRHKI